MFAHSSQHDLWPLALHDQSYGPPVDSFLKIDLFYFFILLILQYYHRYGWDNPDDSDLILYTTKIKNNITNIMAIFNSEMIRYIVIYFFPSHLQIYGAFSLVTINQLYIYKKINYKRKKETLHFVSPTSFRTTLDGFLG